MVASIPEKPLVGLPEQKPVTFFKSDEIIPTLGMAFNFSQWSLIPILSYCNPSHNRRVFNLIVGPIIFVFSIPNRKAILEERAKPKINPIEQFAQMLSQEE